MAIHEVQQSGYGPLSMVLVSRSFWISLSEFFLQSGFRYGIQDVSSPHNLDALRQAIIEKLVEMGRIPEEPARAMAGRSNAKATRRNSRS